MVAVGGISTSPVYSILGDFGESFQFIPQSRAWANEGMLVGGGSFHRSYLQFFFSRGSQMFVAHSSCGIAPATHFRLVEVVRILKPLHFYLVRNAQ